MGANCVALFLTLLMAFGATQTEAKRLVQDAGILGKDGLARTTKKSNCSKSTSTSFKVMQWNILADGLSMDGFLGPPVGRTTKNLKVRRGTKWDEIVKNKKTTKEKKSEFLMAVVTDREKMQAVRNDGKMSELIADSIAFRDLVVDVVDARLNESIAESGQCAETFYKYDKKDIFALLATCAAHWQSSKSFVYKGHEAIKYQTMEPVNQTRNIYFEKPDEITAGIFEEGKCKIINEKKALLLKCGIHDYAGSDLAGFVLDYMNKYANALERFNRKWGLKYMIQASDDLLNWGSAAWQDEEPGFLPKPGRGQMLVDKIEKENPDILMLEELDHYRFFQDALAKLPDVQYSSSMDESRYEYRKDFFNHLPEATDANWVTHFTKKQKGVFAMNTSEAEAAEKEYQKQFLEGNMAKFAYLPKRGSNAQINHPKPIVPTLADTQHNDNDGVAIFWNTARFEVVTIQKVMFPVTLTDKKRVPPGKEGGVCGVLLRDKMNPMKFVWALTTHVPSGDKEENEEERIGMVTSASERIKTWVQDSLTDCGLTGAKSDGAKSEKCEVEMVVGMDGNSHPGYQSGKIAKGQNMINTILDKWQVADYKVDSAATQDHKISMKLEMYKLESGAEDNPKDVYPHSSQVAASVDKMRGLGSSQPWKIGEYQCDRIDYVLMSGGLMQTKAPALPVYKVTRDPKHVHNGTAKEVARMYSGILPTFENPSDHLPMIVRMDYK